MAATLGLGEIAELMRRYLEEDGAKKSLVVEGRSAEEALADAVGPARRTGQGPRVRGRREGQPRHPRGRPQAAGGCGPIRRRPSARSRCPQASAEAEDFGERRPGRRGQGRRRRVLRAALARRGPAQGHAAPGARASASRSSRPTTSSCPARCGPTTRPSSRKWSSRPRATTCASASSSPTRPTTP